MRWVLFVDCIDSLGLVVIKQVSLQLFWTLEGREPVVLVVPPPFSHPSGTVIAFDFRQTF